MKIINLSQRTEEWLQWRRQGVTATDIAAIMGIDPYKNKISIYNSKCGFEDKKFESESMKRGVAFEDKALNSMMRDRSELFTPICVEADGEYSFMRASLDGYNEETQTVLEIKIPTDKNWYAYQKNIPETYIYQVQWQLMVTKAKSALLEFYSPERDEHWKVEISPDIPLHDEMTIASSIFWLDYLKGIPPEIDVDQLMELPSETPKESFIELKRILELKKSLDAQKKALEPLEKKLRQECIDFSDGGDFRFQGIEFRFFEGVKSIDKEAIIADGIDIKKYEKKGSPFWKIQIKQ